MFSYPTFFELWLVNQIVVWWSTSFIVVSACTGMLHCERLLYITLVWKIFRLGHPWNCIPSKWALKNNGPSNHSVIFFIAWVAFCRYWLLRKTLGSHMFETKVTFCFCFKEQRAKKDQLQRIFRSSVIRFKLRKDQYRFKMDLSTVSAFLLCETEEYEWGISIKKYRSSRFV